LQKLYVLPLAGHYVEAVHHSYDINVFVVFSCHYGCVVALEKADAQSLTMERDSVKKVHTTQRSQPHKPRGYK
jgi:hypothetical protein